MFKPGDIVLRQPHGSDAKLMLSWENNKEFWRVSDRVEPLTILDIELLIDQQEKEYHQLDQIRRMIVVKSSMNCIGTVDLYEIDWDKDEAYVGILIASQTDRRKNAAKLALSEIFKWAFEELELDCVKAKIQRDNIASLNLFEKLGFKKKKGKLRSEQLEADYIDFDIFELWRNE